METIPRVQHDTDLLRTITKPIDDIDKLIRCLAPKCNKMLMNGRRNIGIVKENQHQCLVFSAARCLYIATTTDSSSTPKRVHSSLA